LHDHLHELAHAAQPLGLHSLGSPAQEKYRLGTVLLMLGQDFWARITPPGEEADEHFVGDYTRIDEALPYRFLHRHLVMSEPLPADASPELAADLERARAWYEALGAGNEIAAILNALDGRYVPTSYGGDPIKNPDALPTGRNLYGFDPSRVPTPQAWAAGKLVFESLLDEHRKSSSEIPKKLTFSLWSVETMRHQGLLEAQALWALGIEPEWDAGGRVTGVKLIPRETLGRPRVDVVLSATGLYRDHFPNVMKQLAEAARLAALADDEPDNPVAANRRDIEARLAQLGVPEEERHIAAMTRIFSSESGRYGTGLDDATLATDTWNGKAEGDRKLAELYLSRMQFAYGPDASKWGQTLDGVNLYAEHLKGTQGAVLSRTSNLYGMLTTDDPFQYLGGLALAVRHLDGKTPELYISNLRGPGGGRAERAASFMAKELATRNFHPGYIEGLMAEGYAGTLQVLDGVNNFWGWTAVAREIVRDDQWQEFVDVYVRDKHQLGLKDWFEEHNAHALAQTIERMLEAARQEYWNADPAVVQELKERYRDLAERFDVRSENPRFREFVQTDDATASAAGYGLNPATAQPDAAPAEPAETSTVRGMRLDRVETAANQDTSEATSTLIALLLMLTAFGAGAWRQRQAMTAPALRLAISTPN
ncbi:MAG: cobaltochelatase subunit CobN, partial [Ectothiorhodospiraceae bacterium]|nr:cobaltochelatase subunit CobN [Ectothiorhodospiraceae bacterium]